MINQFSNGQILGAGLLVMMNLYTLGLFYVDKRRARKKKYRISEKHLLLASFALGGMGAWIGMGMFRHKTKKTVFKFCVPIAALFTIFITYFVFF